MKHSTFLSFIPRKCIIFLLILFSTTKSEGQTGNFPPAGLLCISDCQTCPTICSPPPAPPSPPSPATPNPLPPPPVHHHSPPQPYYFDSPSPSSPPAHPPPPPPQRTPPPPSYISFGGAAPPPPSVYVYNPGNTVPSQRNFSFPYYYFYASKASCLVPLNQGFIPFVFVFFQVLCHCL